jgi:hexosaminidase
LSDDQGFRVESKRFPRLQQFGSDGNFYTQAEVRQVVAYAQERGIRVVPEFDMPGHTTAWLIGYPELGSAPGPYEIVRKWGVFEPVLDPSREPTYAFLDALIGEMAALFPDPYFHIGGDEVDDAQWKQSSSIQAFAREHRLANSRELQAYFNHRVQKILKKHGKIMIGWDEVLAPMLAPDAVIQSWRGPASLAEAAAKGYGAVLSSGYYLDYLQPAGFHYGIDPLGGAAGNLSAQETARILGGEACMWAEYVSPETVDSRIWPRLAAIAERFWSPRETTDVDSMYQRLGPVSRWLEWAGVRHRDKPVLLLNRLAGGRPAEVLYQLAAVSEATGIEGRRDLRDNASRIPLNRFVDAATPESELARKLEGLVKVLPADRAAVQQLRATLAEWADIDARLKPVLEANAILAEILPLAANLATAGRIGLTALNYIDENRPAPEGWAAAQIEALNRLEQPTAQVRLAAVRPVRLLVLAVPRRATAQIRLQPLEIKRVRSVTNILVTLPQPFGTGQRGMPGPPWR